MKFEHEEKRTPTFREWAKNASLDGEPTFPVIRVFANSEWRTITFVTDDFRINFKYDSPTKYTSQYNGLKKVLTTHCRCFIDVLSKERANVVANAASDADEQPQLFETDDLGFVPKTTKS